MSEPTKEAIEEARSTIAQIGWLLIAPHGSIELNIEDIAELIAHVRQQATSNALELAARVAREYGGIHVERAIRALKD